MPHFGIWSVIRTSSHVLSHPAHLFSVPSYCVGIKRAEGKKKLPRSGIEPETFRSSVWRSPNWAIAALPSPGNQTHRQPRASQAALRTVLQESSLRSDIVSRVKITLSSLLPRSAGQKCTLGNVGQDDSSTEPPAGLAFPRRPLQHGVLACFLQRVREKNHCSHHLRSNVASKDRAHDLRIMRPTRYQLRYCHPCFLWQFYASRYWSSRQPGEPCLALGLAKLYIFFDRESFECSIQRYIWFLHSLQSDAPAYRDHFCRHPEKVAPGWFPAFFLQENLSKDWCICAYIIPTHIFQWSGLPALCRQRYGQACCNSVCRGGRRLEWQSSPATQNRARDHLISAQSTVRYALPTELYSRNDTKVAYTGFSVFTHPGLQLGTQNSAGTIYGLLFSKSISARTGVTVPTSSRPTFSNDPASAEVAGGWRAEQSGHPERS